MYSNFRSILSLTILITSLLFPQKDETKRFVAVTFDDLPMNTKYLEAGNQWIEQTQKLLSIVKQFNIPATGFVNEFKLYVNEVLDSSRLKALQLWVDADLELGNHTFSHPDYHNTENKVFFEDAIKGEKSLKNYYHKRIKSLNTSDIHFCIQEIL